MGNLRWVIEWELEEEGEKHSKTFWREAGYAYTDATVWADAVFELSPNLLELTITLYDGNEILCKQNVLG